MRGFRLSFSICLFCCFYTSQAQNLSSEDLIKTYGLHPKSKIDSAFVPYYSKIFPFYKDILAGRKLKIQYRNQIIPFTSVPSVFNVFRPRNKGHYKINVSKGSLKFIDAICFHALNDSARVGVLAHELSHVKDFASKKPFYVFKVFFGHLSKPYMDHFEFETDHIAIKSGLGAYLLAWSENVNKNLSPRYKDKSFSGKERYMRPLTIKTYIEKYPEIYGK